MFYDDIILLEKIISIPIFFFYLEACSRMKITSIFHLLVLCLLIEIAIVKYVLVKLQQEDKSGKYLKVLFVFHLIAKL